MTLKHAKWRLPDHSEWYTNWVSNSSYASNKYKDHAFQHNVKTLLTFCILHTQRKDSIVHPCCLNLAYLALIRWSLTVLLVYLVSVRLLRMVLLGIFADFIPCKFLYSVVCSFCSLFIVCLSVFFCFYGPEINWFIDWLIDWNATERFITQQMNNKHRMHEWWYMFMATQHPEACTACKGLQTKGKCLK